MSRSQPSPGGSGAAAECCTLKASAHGAGRWESVGSVPARPNRVNLLIHPCTNNVNNGIIHVA
eukprot:3322944-Prymnesium_polylepis.2